VEHREIELFDDGGFHVPIEDGPDAISDSSSDAVEGLVVFLKIGELELEASVSSQCASGLQLFLQGVELG
jgi:hypothetical protein